MSLDYSKLKGQHLIRLPIPYSGLIPGSAKAARIGNSCLDLKQLQILADITNFYFYPHANLDIIIIENVLVPFIGLSGELQKNTYQRSF